LPPRQPACYRPKLPADWFDRCRWKQGALETLAVAQYQRADLAEPFPKSLEARTGRTFGTERGRGIQVEPLWPGQSNPGAALDRLAFWHRSRRQNGLPRCTIPIPICYRWRIAHERHCPQDIAQHWPIGSTSWARALFIRSGLIQPFLHGLNTFQARGLGPEVHVLPFWVESR
jgi:hypothetical protein